MTVAKHNARFPITLHKNLVEVLKGEAAKRGVAGSQLGTFIIETHFASHGLYNPEDSDWRRKLKAQLDSAS